jgi:hypothetical protein
MTTTPDSPAVPAVPSADAVPAGVVEVVQVDAVLTGRAMSSGQFLAGLIAQAQLETLGRPDKLPADLFPDEDPVVVQRIWDRALVVGLHAGRVSGAPRLYRDQMARLEGAFAKAGYEAMAGTLARSRRLVAPVHPADGEDPRGH